MPEDLKPKSISLKQRNSKILIGALLVLSFIFGWAFGHLDLTTQPITSGKVINKQAGSFDFGEFWTVWDNVVSKFDGKLDYQKMLYGAISGMVNSLGDPYTLFMNPDQTKSFNQELSGSINGIGAEVGIKDGNIVVIAPVDGSPAQKSGILAGDIINSIDGESTSGMDLATAVSKIRGNVGTAVKLEITRGTEKLTFNVTRAKIEVKSVKWDVKSDNIGYIEITEFDNNTSDLIKQATGDLKNKNVKAIVLDLRNNPGGYLDAAVSTASEFIGSGVVVSEKTTDRDGTSQTYTASGKGNLTDIKIPLVVLVNGGSASASEIVSGAIQDNGRGILIGEKTFGKGSVQTVDTLPDGSSIRVTIAHWFTPKGKNINKEGITPDITITLSADDAKANKDPQLDKAIEYLKSKIK